MPLNHQRHHLVPVNVATDSPIHIEAARRGIYTVDRAENGKYLAQTAEDWDLYGRNISDDLPFHYGSHPQWDAKAKNVYIPIEADLRRAFVSLENVPDRDLLSAIADIEQELLLDLKSLGTQKLK